MTNITIYTTETCHFCHKAKEFFDENKVEYTAIDVGKEPEKAKEMVEKSGQMGVPVIDIDGEIMVGFNEKKLREKLGL